jgi:hypothetical protein
MIFYHRTTEEAWAKIQDEGVLWGKHSGCRYTYLAPPEVVIPDEYGPVLLEVEYTPLRETEGKDHNYGFDPPLGMICWQFSVFVPIPLSRIKRVVQ